MGPLKNLGETGPWTGAHIQGLIWNRKGKVTALSWYDMLSLKKQLP